MNEADKAAFKNDMDKLGAKAEARKAAALEKELRKKSFAAAAEEAAKKAE